LDLSGNGFYGNLSIQFGGRFCPNFHYVIIKMNKIEVRAIVEIGTLLKEKYCLLEKIGSGGEGIVYLARDMCLERLWCIKISEISDGQRIFCRLGYGRIPQAVDYWEEQGKAYLVMEYIPGCSLKERLSRDKVSRKLRIHWSRQLLQAVRYLHRQKPPVVHGDIKPENLLISQEEHLYLIDFGSAGLVDGGQVRTRKGTRQFAAPEQEIGCCTVQSDIYGVGNVLRLLWKGHSYGNWRLHSVVRRALRKNLRDRYPDCEKLQQDMERAFWVWSRGSSWMRLCGAVGLSVILAAGCFLSLSQEKDKNKDSGRMESQAERKDWEVTLEDVHNAAVDAFQIGAASGSGNQFFGAAKRLGQTFLQRAGGGKEGHLLLLLAQLCQANGDAAGAEVFYKAWMEKYPAGTEGRILYGLMLLRQGDKEASLRLFEACRRLMAGEDTHNYHIWKEKLEAAEER
jgi:hypothetical protein